MKLPKIVLLAATALTGLAASASAVVYNGSYTQNFDSMGTTGTALPAGWSLFKGEGGTNATWDNTTGITANGATLSVASMNATSGTLTVNNSPTATNINGYNAAAPGNTANRIPATSPTSVTGNAFDLTLTNTTGASINSLNLGYTIQRFTSVATDNELPGYEVFLSLDNTTWTNASAFNPTLDGANGTVAVPNTVGATVVPGTAFALPGAWVQGSDLHIRWVDDNAVQTSPDQIIGLDNVTVNAVPEPSAWAAVAMGGAALAVMIRRRALARA